MDPETKVEKRLEWLPAHSSDPLHRIRNPYIMDLLEFTNSSITFNGYFYLDASVFPIERLLITYDYSDASGSFNVEISHIEITEKLSGKDTSSTFYDEEVGGHICFFPTEITTLNYRILQENLTNTEIEVLSKEIIEKELAIEQKHELARNAH